LVATLTGGLPRPSLLVPFCSTDCVERTTYPSGSKISSLVLMRSKSMSADTSARTLPGADNALEELLDGAGEVVFQLAPALVRQAQARRRPQPLPDVAGLAAPAPGAVVADRALATGFYHGSPERSKNAI
jgi:hypothetical protein